MTTFDQLAATKPEPIMLQWSRIGYIFQMAVYFDARGLTLVRNAFLIQVIELVDDDQEQHQLVSRET